MIDQNLCKFLEDGTECIHEGFWLFTTDRREILCSDCETRRRANAEAEIKRLRSALESIACRPWIGVGYYVARDMAVAALGPQEDELLKSKPRKNNGCVSGSSDGEGFTRESAMDDRIAAAQSDYNDPDNYIFKGDSDKRATFCSQLHSGGDGATADRIRGGLKR